MSQDLAGLRSVLGPYESIIESFDKLGLPRKQIGQTLYNTPIYAYRVGNEGPMGLVAAGAHAEEVAGITTAYSLARRFSSGLQAWIVPCRDPLGWDGFRRNLWRAVGQKVSVRSHEDVVAALSQYGQLILNGDLAVGVVGEVAFMSFAESHPGIDDTGVFAHDFLEDHKEVTEQLLGRRLYIHGTPKLTEGRDIYDWGGGPTVYIHTDGRVGNFNRFFAVEAPPAEVAGIRSFADQVVPKWSLDLHEGFGASYCLYSNVGEDPIGREAARAMVQAVAERSFPLMTLSELAAYVGFEESSFVEIALGVYQGNDQRFRTPDAFCPYVGSLGSLCFTTEMGMENPLDVRIDMMEVSARACLKVLTKLGQ